MYRIPLGKLAKVTTPGCRNGKKMASFLRRLI